MNIKQMHIEIEQGVQNLGVFAYADQSHEALDIAIESCTYELIQSSFFPNDSFENSQWSSDLLRVLKTTSELSPLTFSNGYYVDLPANYLHLISDYSVVYTDCYKKIISHPEVLKVGSLYKAVGDVRIGATWFEDGKIFKYVSGAFYGSVKEVPTKRVLNRLTNSEDLANVLDNNYSKTIAISPVSELFGGQLRVWVDGFNVTSVELNYIRKPVKTVYPTVDCELPDNVTKIIIENVVKRIAIRTEQNQQKINNLQ